MAIVRRRAVLAGSIGLSERDYRDRGIEMALALQREGVTLEFALQHAGELLEERAREFAGRAPL